jgi:hypothetical protein
MQDGLTAIDFLTRAAAPSINNALPRRCVAGPTMQARKNARRRREDPGMDIENVAMPLLNNIYQNFIEDS